MLVNYWDSADYITNVEESIKYDKNHELILTKMLNNLGENSSHLYAVEIETINRCNNDCSFCPANVLDMLQRWIENCLRRLSGNLKR